MRTSQNIVSVLLLLMLLLVVLAAQASGAGNHELKRRVAPKQTYTALPEGVNADLIVFKLKEGTDRPQMVGEAFAREGSDWSRLNQIVSPQMGTVALNPRIKLDPTTLDRMRTEGSRRIGWQLPDMSLYYQIQVKSDLPAHDRLDIINRLNALDLVEIAYFCPIPELASTGAETDKDTPNWEYRQYCLQPAPIGLDAFYGWSFPGGRGENVLTIDIEANWNETHEDLHGGIDSFHIAGVKEETAGALYHGTAVLGIIAADSNSFGMTGISYNVDLGTISLYDDWPSVADAILTASAAAEEGDIILIEFQMLGPDGSIVAMEYVQENFDAILTVSTLGQIIVEPAANGSVDYDDTELLDSLFYPDYRFSGAIMVGASYPNHEPTTFTNYGLRLDVHGFGGYDVYTLGLGCLYGTNPDNYYTSAFSGTSAASPMIVGACAILQGIHKELYGTTLDHNDLRNLLTTYSTPQADSYMRIGPLPNLAGACDNITGFIRPASPALVSPAEGAFYDLPAQPLLDWDDVGGATSYDVRIDDNKDFTSPVGQQYGLIATEWTAPALDPGQYFWRVRANNANGFGAWSEPRRIRVDVDIQAPVLFSPADGDKIRNVYNLPFEWYPIDGVVDYVIEIDYYDLNFLGHYKRLAYSEPCDDGDCLTGLYIGLPYTWSWRVKALGEDWPWSDISSVKVNGYPGINEPRGPNNKTAAQLDTGKYGLLTNYPNPFNPTTEISFSLPHACQVKLEVFNIMGQKVTTLVDRHMTAGHQTVNFDGSMLASGIYMYRLQAGEHMESKKMLLLK